MSTEIKRENTLIGLLRMVTNTQGKGLIIVIWLKSIKKSGKDNLKGLKKKFGLQGGGG